MADPERSAQVTGDEELLGDFFDEAREHLENMSEGLLRLEADSHDSEAVNSVFRSLHTIKGVSSFLGLDDINRLSHAGENILDAVRENMLEPSREVIDTLLKTCDVLSALVEDLAVPQANTGRHEQVTQLVAQLAAIGQKEKHPEQCEELSADAAADQAQTGERASAAARANTVCWPSPGTGLSADLVAQFVTETADNLQELEQGLLRLEKHPTDEESINAVFRAIHSIKGTAGYVGLAQIKTLSHHLETVLQLVRAGKLMLDEETADLVFEGADALQAMIAELGPDHETGRDLRNLLGRIVALAERAEGGADTESAASPSQKTAAASDPHLAVFVEAAAQHVESVNAQVEKLTAGDRSSQVCDTLRRSLSTLRNAADYMGREEFFAPCDQLLQLLDDGNEQGLWEDSQLQRATALCSELTDLLQAVCREVQEPAAKQPAPSDSAPQPTGKEQSSAAVPSPGATPVGKLPAAKTMRIDQHKLDECINLAGELVIARNTLAHVFRRFQTGDTTAMRELKAVVEGIDRIATAIQNNAMAMRMVPVKTVFQRFPRVVRDIAKSQGKKIDLQIFGEDTEVDKQVAEALADPLVHLIRNAADHGVETPEERRAAGKSECGLITLKAGREGNFIVIDIIDDGAGIDVQRLKAKAVENGLLTQEQANAMSTKDAFNLIFCAGVSTAKQITDISGRGVGMDVVRTNIVNLGGTISVTSELGEGTRIRIHLPLTLAVTTALLVSAGGQTYAVPIDAVQETVKVPPEAVKKMKKHWAIVLRGKLVPLRPLSQLLNVSWSEGDSTFRLDQANRIRPDHTGRIPVVVVDIRGEKFGLAVDELQGQQEIVLKPLPSYLAHLPGLGSATVMGDGSIVLILDPASLYASVVSACPCKLSANGSST